MHSPLVVGMTPEHDAALRAAGIDTLPALAALDPKEAASATGIRATVLASYRDGARDAIQHLLQENGVADMAALAAADAGALSARTGLPRETLEEYREAARAESFARLSAAGIEGPSSLAAHEDLDALAEATGMTPSGLALLQAAARSVARADPFAAHRPRAVDRIVLDASVPYAHVVLDGVESWSVRVVALGEGEDMEAAARAAGEHAVIVKVGEPVGVAVVGGKVRPGLPLFELFHPPGHGNEHLERRVRVSALRDRS